jgi:hypothetical protein
MSEQLDIVVTSMDVGASEAAKRLAQAFDLSALEAEQFVRELPRVAKRNATREEAARYVEALKAIGARVETLTSEQPRPTLRARMASGQNGGPGDQLLIEAGLDSEPAMRFRAGGHLGMISMPPDEDLHPSFPKAPLIPHDLSRMPNGGELPMPSIRPPSYDEDDESEPRRHTDAQMPPPMVSAARALARGAAAEQGSAPSPKVPSVPNGVPNAKSSQRDAPSPHPLAHAAESARIATDSSSRGTGKALAVALLLGVLVFVLVRLFML